MNGAATIAYLHYMKHLMKQGNRFNYSDGWNWVRETLNTPGESYRMFRMEPNVVLELENILEIVRPPDFQFEEVPSQIRGRKGYPTHNVMLVCNFDMIFTFVVVGWPGSAHDARILSSVLEEMKSVFPHPPEGSFRSRKKGKNQFAGINPEGLKKEENLSR
ncbi:hypothetical protein K1719_013028 [Acacia pycnantha]|nr:hypothetical protein K1719_013028 [Acacia pycnantha]